MFIFDDLVDKTKEINKDYIPRKLIISSNESFTENTNQIIFNDDKAYELGGSKKQGISLDLMTDDNFDDEILLYGKDLDEIREDSNYARIVIGSVDKEMMGTGTNLYNNIRKFDYVKYHLAYDGIMTRESVFNRKESLILSKKGLKNSNLNFTSFGNYIISKFRELKFVRNVKLMFINLDGYKYDELSELVTRCENITKALDHLMNKVKMDCHVCSLQVICNEVEKKVEEDFKKD